MRSHQGFYSPAAWQNAVVADIHSLVFNSYLNWDTCRIVVVTEGIVNHFTNTFSREWIGFHSHIMLIGDDCLQIFGINQVNDPVSNSEEGAFYRILILQIRAFPKFSDFYIASGNDAARLFIKKHGCGTLELSIHQKVKMIKQLFIGDIQIILGHPACSDGLSTEDIKAFAVKVFHANVVYRNRIPSISGLFNKKFCQRRTAQLLLGAAAPIMIFALIADRIGTGIDLDFDIILTVLGKQIDICDDAHCILDLVWDILKELLAVRDANNLSVITDTDIDSASAGIGKSAYPFQVFVSP